MQRTTPNRWLTLLVATVVTTAVLTVAASSTASAVPHEAWSTPISGSQKMTTTTIDVWATDGEFTLDWHLEDSGVPVPGFGGSTSGPVQDGYARFVSDGTGAPDGTYELVGSIAVTAEGVTSAPVAFASTLRVDTVGPEITSIIPNRSTIYPYLGTAKYPNTVKFVVTGGDVTPNTRFEFRNGRHQVISIYGEQAPDGTLVMSWDGQLSYSGSAAPPGTYTLRFFDDLGNPSSMVGTVNASGLRWVRKVFTRKVTAKASLVDKFVGKCASLRSPSSHRWKGSLGLYTNTRCKSRSFRKGGVQTLHSIKIPASANGEYGGISVDTYGGAAKSKRGSTAVVAMLTTTGKYVNQYETKSRVGRSHPGTRLENQKQVFAGNEIAWAVNPSRPGDRYDVKHFYVRVVYRVIGY